MSRTDASQCVSGRCGCSGPSCGGAALPPRIDVSGRGARIRAAPDAAWSSAPAQVGLVARRPERSGRLPIEALGASGRGFVPSFVDVSGRVPAEQANLASGKRANLLTFATRGSFDSRFDPTIAAELRALNGVQAEFDSRSTDALFERLIDVHAIVDEHHAQLIESSRFRGFVAALRDGEYKSYQDIAAELRAWFVSPIEGVNEFIGDLSMGCESSLSGQTCYDRTGECHWAGDNKCEKVDGSMGTCVCVPRVSRWLQWLLDALLLLLKVAVVVLAAAVIAAILAALLAGGSLGAALAALAAAIAGASQVEPERSGDADVKA